MRGLREGTDHLRNARHAHALAMHMPKDTEAMRRRGAYRGPGPGPKRVRMRRMRMRGGECENAAKLHWDLTNICIARWLIRPLRIVSDGSAKPKRDPHERITVRQFEAVSRYGRGCCSSSATTQTPTALPGVEFDTCSETWTCRDSGLGLALFLCPRRRRGDVIAHRICHGPVVKLASSLGHFIPAHVSVQRKPSRGRRHATHLVRVENRWGCSRF